MAPSSPRNPIVCSQTVYLILKTLRGWAFPPRRCEEVMRSDQTRTKRLCRPSGTPRPLTITATALVPCGLYSHSSNMDDISGPRTIGTSHVRNKRKRKFTAVHSCGRTRGGARHGHLTSPRKTASEEEKGFKTNPPPSPHKVSQNDPEGRGASSGRKHTRRGNGNAVTVK